jgi:hypothetical protein
MIGIARVDQCQQRTGVDDDQRSSSIRLAELSAEHILRPAAEVRLVRVRDPHETRPSGTPGNSRDETQRLQRIARPALRELLDKPM